MSTTEILTSYMKPFKELLRHSWNAREGMLLSRDGEDTFLIVYTTKAGDITSHVPCILSGADHVDSLDVSSNYTTHIFRVTDLDTVKLYMGDVRSGFDPHRILYIELDSMNDRATIYTMDPFYDLSAWDAAVEELEYYEEVMQ